MDTGNPAASAARDPEPSFGPDEEGEAPLRPQDIPSQAEKPEAWVKADHAEPDGENRPDARAERSGGGEAAGGVAARAGDPTSPKAAAERAGPTNREMAERGFGDQQGARLDRG